MKRDVWWWGLVTIGLTLSLAESVGWAATIRLNDDTTITGDVFRVDDERIIIGVPRQSVKTIDGKEVPPALVVGVSAPEFSVMDLSGRPQVLQKGQGRITVLHFWIHWCPHCQSDAPELQGLFDRFRHRPDVQILTVNLDQDRAVVEQFVRDYHISYPVILAAEQAMQPPRTDMVALYQVSAFPVTYLIDSQGIIRQKFMGSFAESGERLGERVLELLVSPERPSPPQPHDT